MSYTLNNRTYGQDNIAPGQAKGQENVIATGVVPPAILVDNITPSNAAPLNAEKGATGATLLYGTEIPVLFLLAMTWAANAFRI